MRKVVQIAVVANRKHQWGVLIPSYPRICVHSLTRNILLALKATLVLENMASIPDRTILHGKIFCFYSCKVSVWKTSCSFKLSPNQISKPLPVFRAVCAEAGPLSLGLCLPGALGCARGRVSVQRWQPARPAAPTGDARPGPGHPDTPKREKLASLGSLCPGKDAGIPQSLRWSCLIPSSTAKTWEDWDKPPWFCLHRKIGGWDYCSSWM